MDRLSDDIRKIREIQELQIADQWYHRWWDAYEAREKSAKEFQHREMIRKNAPCFYVKPEKAARYWYDVLNIDCDFDTYCDNINDYFDASNFVGSGCWCSTCVHLLNPTLTDRIKNTFDIPAPRKYVRKRGGLIVLNTIDPFVQEALNNYSSLQGNGICPSCNKQFNLVVPDTKNLAKFIQCSECKTPIKTEEAIRLCFS